MEQLCQVRVDLDEDIEEWKQEDKKLMEENSDAKRTWRATMDHLADRMLEHMDWWKLETASWAEIEARLKYGEASVE
jgi:hypothetical protein